MTQEEKDLLLKDLCARLPYGVKVKHITESAKKIGASYLIDVLNPILYNYILEGNIMAWPYLRPMSSMTEKELMELDKIFYDFFKSDDSTKGSSHCLLFDFYNQYHLDYRGLIEKGLALEAPKGMYYLNEG